MKVRELGGRGLAEYDRAARAQRRHAMRIGFGDALRVQRRAQAGAHAARVDDVLDADGDAVQRAAGFLGVALPGLLESVFRVEVRPGVHARLASLDAGQATLHQLSAADRTCGELTR